MLAAGFTLYLDIRVRNEFEGRRFALPARIYARPLEVHRGLRISQADLEDELRSLGYREAPPEGETGWFRKSEGSLEIALRAFVFWDGRQPAKRVTVSFDQGKVAACATRAAPSCPSRASNRSPSAASIRRITRIASSCGSTKCRSISWSR